MSRQRIIGAGILILVIIGSAIFIHGLDLGSAENTRTKSTVKPSGRDEIPGAEINSDLTDSGTPGEDLQPDISSAGEESDVFHYSNETTRPSSMENMQRAFSGQASIVEAVQNAGSQEGWSYDELTENLMLWKSLCNAPESRFDRYNAQENGSQTTSEKIKGFCTDYPSEKELDEFGLIHLEETVQGSNDWSRRLNSISDLGPDTALEAAIMDLDDALYAGNYAAISEIVWFLGSSGLLAKQPNMDEAISALFADPRVMLATSAGIFCARLGGCSGTHPVTLDLCFQLSDRQCHNPANLHHAAEQILTGRELASFYQMHQVILSLVSQYRRDKF